MKTYLKTGGYHVDLVASISMTISVARFLPQLEVDFPRKSIYFTLLVTYAELN